VQIPIEAIALLQRVPFLAPSPIQCVPSVEEFVWTSKDVPDRAVDDKSVRVWIKLTEDEVMAISNIFHSFGRE
jgi:hypothetical protein